MARHNTEVELTPALPIQETQLKEEDPGKCSHYGIEITKFDSCSTR
jgi:hypothetical protein